MTRRAKITFLVLLGTFALLCWKLPRLHGQGFGSFSHDQPFLAADPVAASPSGYPQQHTNIGYYWVADDVPDGLVATWTDRIAGAELTQPTEGAQPTKYAGSNGVAFYGAVSLTNLSIEFWENTPDNRGFTVWFVTYKTNYQSARAYFFGSGLSAQSLNANNGILVWDGGSFGAGTCIGTGVKDFTVNVTNAYPLGAPLTGKTNNVDLTDMGFAISSFHGGVYVGARYDGVYPLNGEVLEFAIFTNRISDADLVALHSYATNKYNFAP